MPTLSALIQMGQVCQCLREKKMFYESAVPLHSLEIVVKPESAGPDGPFWCAQTQGLTGPDGRIADAESCCPGRACCETA